MIAVVMTFSVVLFGQGCGGTKKPDEDSGSPLPSGVTNPFTLKVFNFNGGYGSDWLTALESRYEKERAGKTFTVNGKTYDGVDVKITADKSKMMEDMAASYNFASHHIYFHEDVWYSKYLADGNIFEDITEALTTENPYEAGVKLEKKLSPEQKEYYLVNGKYYGVPHYAGYVGLNYDIDLFTKKGYYLKDGYSYSGDTAALARCFTKKADEKTAGPDGVKGTEDDGLPTTYDEFFMLCGYIAQNNDIPMTWDNKNNQKYLNWFLSSLTASYEGLEQMKLNFDYEGTAKNLVSVDASGNVTALPETVITPDNGYELAKQAGRYYGLSFLEKIIDNKWYSSDAGNDNIYAQQIFVMGTETDNKVAMLIDGVWWENEASPIFSRDHQLGQPAKKDRNYGFMPLPAATAEKAQERVTAMAQNKAGYTLLDTHNSLCFVGKGISADEKKIAIDFIQYAYTDVSLTEFTKITDTTKALQYTVSEDDKKEMSAYGRSIITMQEKADIVYSFSPKTFWKDNETKLSDYDDVYVAEVSSQVVSKPMSEFIGGKSAKQYFDGLYTYRSGTLWNTLTK